MVQCHGVRTRQPALPLHLPLLPQTGLESGDTLPQQHTTHQQVQLSTSPCANRLL